MQGKLAPLIFGLVLAALGGVAAGYFIGYDHGFENAADGTLPQQITSFEDCAAAGYPIQESYPERCAVPGGPTFTRELGEDEAIVPPVPTVPEGEAVFCTQDAQLCQDGSFVSRMPPSCQFAPCPGE